MFGGGPPPPRPPPGGPPMMPGPGILPPRPPPGPPPPGPPPGMPPPGPFPGFGDTLRSRSPSLSRGDFPPPRAPRQQNPSQPSGERTRGRRKKKFFKREERSLVLFIMSLIDRKVVVELRNDLIVRGKLEDVDEFMNLTLSGATLQTTSGTTVEYEFLYVKGRNIRYVHLPKSLDPAKSIASYRKRVLDEKIEQAKERARMMSTKLQKGVTEEEYFAMQESGMEGGEDAEGGAGGYEEGGEGGAEGEDEQAAAARRRFYGTNYMMGQAVEGEDLYYSSSGEEDDSDDEEGEI